MGSGRPKPAGVGKRNCCFAGAGGSGDGRRFAGRMQRTQSDILPFYNDKTPVCFYEVCHDNGRKNCHSYGASKWITREAARADVQQQRHRFSGIMVGVGTILADDPLLTCHMENGKNPVRIVCDTQLRTPLQAQVVATAKQIPTILATCCADPKRQAIYRQAGCRVICLDKRNGHIDLVQLMEKLGQEQIDSILLEGGGTLNWAALESGVVQQVQAYIAPKLFGGQEAKTPVEGAGVPMPSAAFRLKNSSLTHLGEDILIESEVEYPCSLEL